MFGTAAEYRTINGLKPDAKKHLIFADIEPVCIDSIGIEFQMFDKFGHFVNIFQKKKYFVQNTGYPVRGAKRLQLNMFLKRINQIDVTEKLQTALFPVCIQFIAIMKFNI